MDFAMHREAQKSGEALTIVARNVGIAINVDGESTYKNMFVVIAEDT
ncbi:hypothetical protein BOVMAS09_07980 [Streptococcus uberis]